MADANSKSKTRGLPPPTRGIPNKEALREANVGSTPAHAGNTTQGEPIAVHRGVYPRPRGEYLAIRLRAASAAGLPPPTRGILFVAYAPEVLLGSTPAHAGNTSGWGIA